MDKHPHSVWSLGGIPSGENRVPAAADVESWGTTWREATDEYLTGVAARAYGQLAETAASPALIESQRRLTESIKTFNSAATAQVAELVTLSTEAGRQATTMIRLTWAIIALTVVLGIIAGAQLWAMWVKGA